MNAYHARMEHVLGAKFDLATPAGRNSVGNEIAVLGYLAADLGREPPPEVAGSAEFRALFGAVEASLEAVRTSLAKGDPEAIRAALRNLKPAYSRLFLKFG